MAGWSKRVDGSGLESFRSPENVSELDRLLKEVNGCLCLRPYPPMLGDGKMVDLCKLYLVVREKGGYQRVCTSGSWGVVAKECGFDPSSGLALKLVYVKYLDVLSKTMLKLEKPENESGALGFSAVRMMDLEEVLMRISNEKTKAEEHGKIEFDGGADGKLSNGIGVPDFVGLVRCSEDFAEKGSLDDTVCDVKGVDGRTRVAYGEEDSNFVNQNEDEECDTNDVRLMELSGDEEDCVIRKRKYSDEKMSVGCDEEHLEFVNENGDVQDGPHDITLTKFCEDEQDNITRKRKSSDEKMSVGYDEHLKIDDGNGDAQGGTDDSGLTKFSGDEEDDITRQSKRVSYMDMLKWVTELAKDPCDPAIGHLPERSKWKSYGNEVVWKKVLLLRNEMILEGNVDTSAQCSIWQKMHPSMYDGNSGSERLRCSQRVISAKDSLKNPGSHIDRTLTNGPSDSSAESVVWWNRRRKKIAAIGSEFQADVPEWKNDVYESDSKWLGAQIWPLDKNEQSSVLIERDPVGKGRGDTCGCEYPGSYDCIRFHLSEKRRKLKLELGSAFYLLKFDSMGEKVTLSWTTKDEHKFHDIAKSSPLSEDESFSYWPEIFRRFPHKSRESLVSYYFNVFLLRRTGQQIRMNASDVDSDDDESGCGPRFICFGRNPKFSILCSPKKACVDSI
ncbi:unnamed protein product [Withania somnifera]